MLATRIARVVSVVVAVGFVGGLFAPALAGAEESRHAHLEGQILVTQEPLPRTASAERTIELYERHRQEVIHADENTGARWSFRFMAFMTEQPRTGELELEVYRTADDEWVTSARLFTSPRMTIINGRASLSADDGVEAGESYKLRLVAERNGKRSVLAQTRIVTETQPRVASR